MKYLFLGGQGSGKSTQAKLLANKFKLPYLEMGQVLRERSKENDRLARNIKEATTTGHLVDNQITIDLLKAKTMSPPYREGYILDGYPRNEGQMENLDRNIDKVFYINVSDKKAIKRLEKRARSDDTTEVLAKRLEIYHKDTEPLLEEFRERELLIEIDGEKVIKDVHKQIMGKIEM